MRDDGWTDGWVTDCASCRWRLWRIFGSVGVGIGVEVAASVEVGVLVDARDECSVLSAQYQDETLRSVGRLVDTVHRVCRCDFGCFIDF